jgi:hypothetical protein
MRRCVRETNPIKNSFVRFHQASRLKVFMLVLLCMMGFIFFAKDLFVFFPGIRRLSTSINHHKAIILCWHILLVLSIVVFYFKKINDLKTRKAPPQLIKAAHCIVLMMLGVIVFIDIIYFL